MSGLTAKQERAIAALLSESSIAAAAVQVGVTERTVYRWLDEPTFSEAYRQARQQVVQQALVRVQALTSNAVRVLEAVMTEDSVPPGTRLAAAKVALEYAVKAVELEDLASRLARLERVYEERSM